MTEQTGESFRLTYIQSAQLYTLNSVVLELLNYKLGKTELPTSRTFRFRTSGMATNIAYFNYNELELFSLLSEASSLEKISYISKHLFLS